MSITTQRRAPSVGRWRGLVWVLEGTAPRYLASRSAASSQQPAATQWGECGQQGCRRLPGPRPTHMPAICLDRGLAPATRRRDSIGGCGRQFRRFSCGFWDRPGCSQPTTRPPFFRPHRRNCGRLRRNQATKGVSPSRSMETMSVSSGSTVWRGSRLAGTGGKREQNVSSVPPAKGFCTLHSFVEPGSTADGWRSTRPVGRGNALPLALLLVRFGRRVPRNLTARTRQAQDGTTEPSKASTVHTRRGIRQLRPSTTDDGSDSCIRPPAARRRKVALRVGGFSGF